MLSPLRAVLTGFIAPCLPTNAPHAPSGEMWLHVSSRQGRRRKKIANLIIRPGNTNQISMGPAFDSLKPYQRCSASGEPGRP
jgi:hypothetical protein